MTTHEQDPSVCPQCGAKVASDRRYCVHCYSPVGASASRAHVELARETASTHRPDPTLVFSPERHEAMVRRARSRKRMMITAVIALAVVVAGSIVLNIINRDGGLIYHREFVKSQKVDLRLVSSFHVMFAMATQISPGLLLVCCARWRVCCAAGGRVGGARGAVRCTCIERLV